RWRFTTGYFTFQHSEWSFDLKHGRIGEQVREYVIVELRRERSKGEKTRLRNLRRRIYTEWSARRCLVRCQSDCCERCRDEARRNPRADAHLLRLSEDLRVSLIIGWLPGNVWFRTED